MGVVMLKNRLEKFITFLRTRNGKGAVQNPFYFLAFMPLSVFFMELLFKLAVMDSFFDVGLLFTLLFSGVFGLLLAILCISFKRSTNRKITLVCLAVLGVFFSFYYVYFSFFKTFFVWSTLGLAGNLLSFWKETILATLLSLHMIILFFLPFLFYLFLGKTYAPCYRFKPSARLIFTAFALVLHFLNVGFISIDNAPFGTRYYYVTTLSPADTVRYFGVVTTQRIEIKQMIFGAKEFSVDLPDANASSSDTASKKEDAIVYKPNVMDIDLAALANSESNRDIQSLHTYFSEQTPTLQNEYTGMFKGKNLIFMTLEGFSYKIIDPQLTPTLYKMSTEGFVFNNFYTSMWGGSTATGEYAATTGNFYNTAQCLKISADKYLPFTMGNQFKKLGYKTLAYHNNTYTYYGRDKSHPNMGYTFKAIDNGLTLPTKSWPYSDAEMAAVTLPDFTDGKPFHAYYMTVSGHANYNWMGNKMSSKHRDEVADLPYSENVKAYLACQLEVEYMLNTLIDGLNAAGILEDTVFAMSADHYPYALSNSELSELYGLPAENIENNFDLYRNSFILWSAGMEKPIVVDKPCSAIDIIPTLSNLFGLEYDSRLLMGRDILSTTEPLVILNCNGKGGSWHWITDKGTYNNRTKVFTPSALGEQMTAEQQESYVQTMRVVVSRKQTTSLKVLDKDYYRYVFK
ncbi:MAG: sulfatase-like hydrolase/transferase [Clostridia bacterium]|nr:sulfatase-like hydrolase/transferase [Clostridia bacterium]